MKDSKRAHVSAIDRRRHHLKFKDRIVRKQHFRFQRKSQKKNTFFIHFAYKYDHEKNLIWKGLMFHARSRFPFARSKVKALLMRLPCLFKNEPEDLPETTLSEKTLSLATGVSPRGEGKTTRKGPNISDQATWPKGAGPTTLWATKFATRVPNP